MNPYPINVAQIIGIIGSAFLIFVLILLMRKKKLKEEYAIFWLLVFIFFLVLSIFRGSIDFISNLLGIHYQPASLFLILIGALFLLMLHFSIVISDLKAKMHTLVTSLTLLEEKISKMEEMD